MNRAQSFAVAIFFVKWLCMRAPVCSSSAIFSWTKKSLSDLTPTTSVEGVLLSLNPQLPNACVLDAVHINWNVSLHHHDVENARLAILYEASSEVLMSPLTDSETVVASDATTGDHSHTDSPQPLLRCAIDETHCKVQVGDIVANPDTDKLIIQFSADTNEPPVHNTRLLLQAMTMHPAPTSGVVGVWATPSRLEIAVDEKYLSQIINFYKSGNIVTFAIREGISRRDNTATGHVSLRMTQHGLHKIFVVDSVQSKIISHIHTVNAVLCNETIAPRIESSYPASFADKRATSELPTKPLMHVKGTISLSGKSGINIPNKNFQEIAKGTWAISMWIYLLETPTGSYRCLFHKGKAGESSHRTPSAWLAPLVNKLAIRVSTSKDYSIGADTSKELRVGQWTFLTFSFLNLTNPDIKLNTQELDSSERNITLDVSAISSTNTGTGGAGALPAPAELVQLRKKHGITSDAVQYVISVYVNGAIDIAISFPDIVVGNEHPLQLFKDDVSGGGPLAFVKDTVLWNSALTSEEVTSLYLTGPGSGDTKSIDAVTDLFKYSSTKTSSSDSNYYKHSISNNRRKLLPTLFADFTTLSSTGTSESSLLHFHAESGSATLLGGVSPGHERNNFDSIEERLKLSDEMFARAKESLQSCEPFATRMDLYAEAARNGNVESLFHWAMLLAYGSETPDNQCGINHLKKSKISQDKLLSSHYIHDVDMIRSIFALVYCVELGLAKAMVPLAMSLQSGIGVQAFLFYNDPALVNLVDLIYDSIPLPFYLVQRSDDAFSSVDISSEEYSNRKALKSAFHEYITNLVVSQVATGRSSSPAEVPPFGSPPQIRISPVGLSVVDIYGKHQVDSNSPNSSIHKNIFSMAHHGVMTSELSDLAIGMLHVAASYEVDDAYAALAFRYQHGIGITKDAETAVFYAYRASSATYEAFHRLGGQPIKQEDRITDKTEQEVYKGNQGVDDEIIQARIVQADEGHVPSMVHTADSYYFGANGLPRDQPRALHYYNRAAQGGDTYGMSCAAAMYLKGEGVDQNTTQAVELYEKAASLGSNKALNGLGYLYFFGQSVPKNETKGFEYFLQAALTETDGDALGNAGQCLQHGLGTAVDVERAARFYMIAAQKFGHFDSVRNAASMYMEGVGVPRSATDALTLFTVANQVGPWIGWIRRGLDQYLSGNYHTSLLCYVYAGDLGYEVAQSNAAFVIRRKLQLPAVSDDHLQVQYPVSRIGTSTSGDSGEDSPSMHCNDPAIGAASLESLSNQHSCSIAPAVKFSARSLNQVYNILHYRELMLSALNNNKDSPFLIGHFFFTGSSEVTPGNAPDYHTALWWYSKASSQGNSLASFYVGAMNHFAVGVLEKNLPRAIRYYKKALEDKDLEYQLQWVAKSLLYMAEYGHSYAFVDMSSSVLEMLIKRVYKLEGKS